MVDTNPSSCNWHDLADIVPAGGSTFTTPPANAQSYYDIEIDLVMEILSYYNRLDTLLHIPSASLAYYVLLWSLYLNKGNIAKKKLRSGMVTRSDISGINSSNHLLYHSETFKGLLSETQSNGGSLNTKRRS